MGAAEGSEVWCGSGRERREKGEEERRVRKKKGRKLSWSYLAD